MEQKKFWKLILVISLTLVLVSCTWEEVQLEMQFSPQVGDIYHITMEMNQDITQAAEGQEMNVQQIIGFGYSIIATEQDEAGNIWLDIEYEWVRVSQITPMGTIEYDSADPAAEPDPMVAAFDALIGKHFSIQVSPSGAVLEIAGLDTMVSELLADMGVEDEALLDQMETQISEQYSAETLKEQMGNVLIDFPEGQVKIGDTWTASSSASSVVPILVENIYTLQSYDDGIATLDVSSTIVTDPQTAATDMGFYTMDYDLAGTQTGQIHVDVESGWAVRSVVTQTVSGEVFMQMEGEELQIPMSMVSVVTIEMVQE